jgi:hypothetical protein
MRPYSCLAAAAFVGVFGTGLTPRTAHGSIVYRTVVLSGATVPGLPFAGETLAAFAAPTINASGLVAFTASSTFSGAITSPSTANVGLALSEGSGSLAFLGQQGTLAPSAAGGSTTVSWAGTWNIVGTPFLDNSGHALLSGTLRFPLNGGSNASDGTVVGSTDSSGLWSDRSGSVAMTLRLGTTTPTGSAGPLTSFSLAGANTGGTLLATGGTATDSGILTDRSGSLAYAVKAGDQAPGTGGAVFNSGLFSGPVMNNLGRIAFRASLVAGGGSPPVVNNVNSTGIWSEGSGSLQLVARQGSVAVGTSGALFSSFGTPGINDAGQTVFQSSLTGGDVSGTTNNGGIWSEGGGTLHLVARKGGTAPDAGSPQAVFNAIATTSVPLINHAGEIAFPATLVTGAGGVTSANSAGIWSEGSGSLHLVARQGFQAPGTAAGDLFSTFANLAMNAPGNVAFQATLLSGVGDVTTSNNSGIWAQDQNGILQLVARTGQPFTVAPGDVRTILSLSFNASSAGEDGKAITFDDSNALAFYATFTNGTNGVFTATVPEPTLLGLVTIPAILLRRNRRRA